MTFQKQGLSQKRPFESEEGALGQQQYLARLRELQNASETSLVNFPKSLPKSGTKHVRKEKGNVVLNLLGSSVDAHELAVERDVCSVLNCSLEKFSPVWRHSPVWST